MNLLQFINQGIRPRSRKPRLWIVDEGEVVEYKRNDKFVHIKRAYIVDRNKYQPRTARRPKEAARATRRAA